MKEIDLLRARAALGWCGMPAGRAPLNVLLFGPVDPVVLSCFCYLPGPRARSPSEGFLGLYEWRYHECMVTENNKKPLRSARDHIDWQVSAHMHALLACMSDIACVSSSRL